MDVRSEWAKARLRWRVQARGNQILPEGDPEWDIAFMQAGRGWGKTISGAQDISEYARTHVLCRLALVGPTFGDVRDTMVEGETGILSVLPPSALRGGAIDTAWNRSMGELHFSNGAYAKGFSSERPDRLRGPQHDRAWVEEPASFKDARAGDVTGTTWNNLQLGLRLGERPRCIVTGTPKRVRLIKDILKTPRLLLVRGSTYDNLANLSPDYRRRIVDRYRGTRVARQELMGEYIEEVEGALWRQEELDAHRVLGKSYDDLKEFFIRTVIAIDPAVTSGEDADETGIVAAARTANKHCPQCGVIEESHAFVVADCSGRGFTPKGWADEAIGLYDQLHADRIVAEVNNGGELVEFTLRTVNPHIPYRAVHASRGKQIRAEPIAAMFEQGRVHLLGIYQAEREEQEALEDQLTTWTPEAEGIADDRLDAMVWALTDLMLGPEKRKMRIIA